MGWQWTDQTPRRGEVLVGLWVAPCSLDFIPSRCLSKDFQQRQGVTSPERDGMPSPEAWLSQEGAVGVRALRPSSWSLAEAGGQGLASPAQP